MGSQTLLPLIVGAPTACSPDDVINTTMRLRLLVVAAGSACAGPLTTSIGAAILGEMVPSAVPTYADAEIAFALAAQRGDGSWPDIDYNDTSGRSWWDTGMHLRRCLLAGTVYHTPSSQFYNESQVQDLVVRGLSFWFAADPLNSNWWWNQLGTPRCVGKILILLGPQRSAALLPAAQTIFARAPISWAAAETGCNKVWGATVSVLAAVATGNDSLLQRAYEVAHDAVVVSPQDGDGIQVRR